MIPLPISPKLIKQEGNTGYFEMEGLFPGYGVTVGNALRRVLLSSLEGAAITQVKIKGVLHEFSTLNGVSEDVVIILLNLKKIDFRSFSEEPQVIHLKVKGEKEAKAKDFKLTSEVELANPDQHIATLTKPTAELDIEATVEKGVGYEPLERREREKAEVGVIYIDAIFSPVRRVKMSVENMRVGKRTDFDKLKLEIETNGVLTPQEAWKKASDILQEHVNLVARAFEEPSSEELSLKSKKDKQEKAVDSFAEEKKIKIQDLDIPERAKNGLLASGVKTVGGLLKKTERDLLELEGMGEKALTDVKKVLKKMKLELKHETS